ncbi:MAG: thiamine phosphate synthase [Acidimicrobiales bacterium]
MTSLPALVVLTDRRQARAGLVPTVAAAVEGGARAVVLREKDLPRPARWELGRALRAVLDPHGAMLLVAGPDVELAEELGAGGVHLAAGDAWPSGWRPPLVGRSCHDAVELQRAAEEAADYATLSPVFASASKPGYGPALTEAGLAELAAATELAVFALGGVTAESAGPCLGAGAAGVAVMGAVMGADDPAGAAAALVASMARELHRS